MNCECINSLSLSCYSLSEQPIHKSVHALSVNWCVRATICLCVQQMCVFFSVCELLSLFVAAVAVLPSAVSTFNISLVRCRWRKLDTMILWLSFRFLCSCIGWRRTHSAKFFVCVCSVHSLPWTREAYQLPDGEYAREIVCCVYGVRLPVHTGTACALKGATERNSIPCELVSLYTRCYFKCIVYRAPFALASTWIHA